MKKLVSYLIAVMMVFTMMPYTAFAESEVYEMKTPAYTWINPAYEDVISEEDFVSDSEPVSLFSARVTYATTPEEAAAVVKEAFVNKIDSFMIYYKYPAADVDAEGIWFDKLCDEIFMPVFEHTGIPYEGDYIYYSYGGYSIPETSFSGDGTYWYLELPVNAVLYTTYDQEEEMTAAVDALLAEIIDDGMTDYEKIKAIYDYMTANIVYDDYNLGNESYKLQYTAYAALVNKTSVCQGYANLFYRLALECGIDARIIEGVANGGPHAWNIVKLNNQYYCVDATWDASYAQAGYEYEYFLKPSFNDHTTADKFLTDEFMAAYPMADSVYSVCTTHVAEVVPAVPATCTATGWTEGQKCANCGQVIVKQEVTTALGHDEVAHAAQAPTCTEIGWDAYVTCSRCDYTTYEEIPALGHTYGEWIIVTKATLSKDGRKDETCWCGETLNTVAINKLSEVELVEYSYEYNGMVVSPQFMIKDSAGQIISESNYEIIEPTIKPKEIGRYTYTVNFLGEYSGTTRLSFTIKPPQVSIENMVAETTKIQVSWTSLNEHVTGYEIFTATEGMPFTKRCTITDGNGSSKTLTGLDPGTMYQIKIRSYKTVEGTRFYSDFSEVESVETLKASSCVDHIWSDGIVAVEPECEATGETLYNCLNEDCDEAKTEIIPATGHNYEAIITDPTCFEEGYTTYICECGDSYMDNYVAATNHPNRQTIKGKPATCTETGLTDTEMCLDCSLILEPQEVIKALGHTPGAAATCTTAQVCSVCGEELTAALDHDLIKHEAKDPTCEDGGWTEYYTCSRCDYTTLQMLGSEAHIFVEETIPATCTERGYTQLRCIGCGKTVVTGETLPLGHRPEAIPAVPATASETGLTAGVKCSVCDKVIVEQHVIPKVAAVTLKTVKFVYSSTAKKPGVTVKDAEGNVLKQGTDFTVKYINAAGKTVAKPINVGTYRAVVTFKGDYSGSVKLKYTINPKGTQLNKLTKPGKKQIKVTWQKRTAQVTGYEIQYSTTKNFTKKTTKTLKIKNFKTNVKAVKQLKAKKKYWVKIRTYKSVNGKPYYSTWSKVKMITTK